MSLPFRNREGSIREAAATSLSTGTVSQMEAQRRYKVRNWNVYHATHRQGLP